MKSIRVALVASLVAIGIAGSAMAQTTPPPASSGAAPMATPAKPMAKKPAAKKTMAKKPAAKKPMAKKPAAKKTMPMAGSTPSK